MGEEKKPKSSGGVWPTVKPFVNGGASGMLATCVIQPIDMIKVFSFSLFQFILSLVFGLDDESLCVFMGFWICDFYVFLFLRDFGFLFF